MNIINVRMILSQCQIGFSSGCSIWQTHKYLDSHLQLTRRKGQYAALVTVDITKAYESAEHGILVMRLRQLKLRKKLQAWSMQFLSDWKLYCFQNGITSSTRKQAKVVPQEALLCAVLFNILLSSMPFQGNTLQVQRRFKWHLRLYREDELTGALFSRCGLSARMFS